MTTSLFLIYSNFILMCEILLQCFIIMVLISFLMRWTTPQITSDADQSILPIKVSKLPSDKCARSNLAFIIFYVSG